MSERGKEKNLVRIRPVKEGERSGDDVGEKERENRLVLGEKGEEKTDEMMSKLTAKKKLGSFGHRRRDFDHRKKIIVGVEGKG